MKTVITSEDLKNIIENEYNGNLEQWKADKSIQYRNANSERILLTDDSGVQTEQDLAKYLNIKFYTWKNRLVDKTAHGTVSLFDDWLQSLNYSLNESYALVESIDCSATASQDIDNSAITGKITFIVQTDKAKNLDYYSRKVRNALLGKPQIMQNASGDKITYYLNIGIVLYDGEPIMTPLGECITVSLNFSFIYLNSALNYSDTKLELSLDNETYYSLPYLKTTWQKVWTTQAVPKQTRPDMTGFISSAVSEVKTISYYDFNQPFALILNSLFWRQNAISIDGVDTVTQEVNIPIWLKITSDGHSYVYKDIIVTMEKVLQNSDYNISSITLKGWGKT